jgi:hypothetical protein
MKTVIRGFVITFAAVGLLFGTTVGSLQAAVSKTSPQTSMHHPRHVAHRHVTHHLMSASNQCRAAPGTMRALFCPAGTSSTAASKK